MFSIGFAPKLPVNSIESVNIKKNGSRQIRNTGGFRNILAVLVVSMIFLFASID
jgi:hypothetical protein|tara:strand:+ start:253 stop:414 length:162 start_codon:yes stop_codon:yes gene_type:complete